MNLYRENMRSLINILNNDTLKPNLKRKLINNCISILNLIVKIEELKDENVSIR